MNQYITTIGMEVHLQLNTRSKLFCNCSAQFGDDPNTNICPICMGMPGTMPVINRNAVRKAVKAALALGCSINMKSGFARKNYFYPDLPKGYQITQFKYPIAENGSITLDSGRRIRIRRLHIEEDSGKLIHDIDRDTLVDFNRAGVGLIEIVTEPDIKSSADAVEYLKKLRRIIRYCGVSDANMEKGQMRAEPNISIRQNQSDELGTKTEIKNLNSFKAVSFGIEAEVRRQSAMKKSGKDIISETLLYNEKQQSVQPMRKKETAGDYRYFPEPDLPSLILTDRFAEDIRKGLPEMPQDKKERLSQAYDLKYDIAEILVSDIQLADFFEESMKGISNKKRSINFFVKEIPAILNKEGIDIMQIGFSPQQFNSLLLMIEAKKINLNAAGTVLRRMYDTGKEPRVIVSEMGLEQTSDSSEIEDLIDTVIEKNPGEVKRYRDGERKLFGFFVGQVMRESRGKADPHIVNEILKKKL
ncbi:MAG: Asp-tRNA(Asn)/Glu-tRNA(Gln) amidotransferase subunit GatB [bacterium]